MERKLASVQIIEKLSPIQGADFIEVAKVLGWECVVKKGDFSVGQKCVYIEVDSIVPDTSDFEFMRDRHFRVKTIKLRKQISQGLVIPISILDHPERYIVGTDVTRDLLITKYDPEAARILNITRSGGGLFPFPTGIPKTDEMRVQSVPDILGERIGKSYYITQKQDGCSATYTYDHGGKFHVCSRNFSIPEHTRRKRNWQQRFFSLPWRPFTRYDLTINDNIYWRVEKKYQLRQKLLGYKYAIQGEICAPGLQKNRLCLLESEFYIFNVFDWDGEIYLDVLDAMDVVDHLGLKFVPVLEAGVDFHYSQESLLQKAKGIYPGTTNQ